MSRHDHYYPTIDWQGDHKNENVVVWLPAFGDSGSMTARPYIQNLQQQGWTVMVTNHPQGGFKMTDSVNAVLRNLYQTPRDRVLLVGASFGAQILAEVLRHAQSYSLSSKKVSWQFSAICVCGVSAGDDTLKPIGWSRRIHGPVSGSLFKLGQAIQITVGTKSPFDEDDDEVAAAIEPHIQFRKWHFTGRALLEQMNAMASTPPVYDGEFPDVPALILTTKGKDVLLKPQAAEKLARAFTRSWTVRVEESIHCDLTELPSRYGPDIWEFAKMVIETSVAFP